MQVTLVAVLYLFCCSFSMGQDTTFVCYSDSSCGENVQHPVYKLSDSYIGCCGKPNVLSVLNDDNICQVCSTPTAARVTARNVAIYPPSQLVLEINATSYSGISWLVNGTTMHDFSRLSLENSNKKFTLSDTTNEDVGEYVAAVHFINGTIATIDFHVALYVSPYVSITNPSETDIYQDYVNVTCISQGNPGPTTKIYCDDPLNYTSYNDVVIDGSFGGNLTSVIATIQVDSRNADGLKKCHCIASAFNGTDNESKVKSILLLASSPFLIYNGDIEMTVVAPRILELNCMGQGRPLPEIIWYKDKEILSTSSKISINEIVTEYAISSVISIAPTDFNDDGIYECTAENLYGNYTQNITVEIQFPPIVTTTNSTYNLNANIYDKVTLRCQAFGNPEPQLIWVGKNGILNDKCIGGTLDGYFGEAAIDYSEFYNFSDFSDDFGVDPSNLSISCSINITRNESASPFPITMSTLTIFDLHLLKSTNFVCIGDNGIDKLPNRSSRTLISLMLNGSPYIVQQPEAIFNLREGDEAKYTCSIISKTPATITWYLNGIPVTDVQFLTTRAIINDSVLNNVYNSTLTIANTQQTDAGIYTCRAANDNGTSTYNTTQNILTSFSVTLIDSTQTITEGSDFHLSCIGAGNPLPVLSWYFTSSVTGETEILTQQSVRPNSTLSIDTVAIYEQNRVISMLNITSIYHNDAGIYTCKADNLRENGSSNITVTVLVPPTIVDTTSVHYVILGDTNVSIPCQATGIPAPTVTITYFGLPPFFSVGTPMETTLLSSGLYLSTTQLFFHTVNSHLNDLYTCYAINELGTVASTFLVNTQSGIVIETDYKALSVIEGENLTLYCNVSTFGTPMISWRNGSNELIYASDTISNITSPPVSLSNGQQSFVNTLTITNIQSSDAGSYYCQATNQYESATMKITDVIVQVFPSVSITPLTSLYIQDNSTLVTCIGTGIPLPSLTFDGIYCDSSIIIPAEAPELIEGDNFSGYCDSSDSDVRVVIVVENTTLLGSLAVQCNATSSIGSINTSAVIYITGPASSVTISPSNISYVPGDTINLQCTASGYPAPHIQWSYKNLSNIISNETVTSSNDNLFITQSNLTLTLSNDDGGVYYCIASNEYYTTLSTDSVIVSSLGIPPSILTQSGSYEYIVGSNVSLTCEASGLPAPEITWKTKGLEIQGDAIIETYNTTGTIPVTTSVVLIQDFQVSDEGKYYCVAGNNVTDEVEFGTHDIFVIVPPTVQIIPSSITHYVPNQETLLTCIGMGKPSPAVTFGGRTCPAGLANTQDLPGITTKCGNTVYNSDDYYITTVQYILNTNITNFDQYELTCIAQNTAHTIANATATVHIEVTKYVFTSPLSATLNEKDTFVLTCTATGYPRPTIDWLYGEDSGAIVNSERRTISDTISTNPYTVQSVLTLTNLVPNDAGEYKCKAQYANEHLIDSTQLYVLAIDDCKLNNSNPCVNGNCTDLLDNYVCECFTNYTGTNCDERIINVTRPIVVENPENYVVYLLGSFNLTCEAIGTVFEFSWKKDGRVLDTKSDIYEVKEAKPEDRGYYICIAGNTAGNSTSEPGLVEIPGIYQYIAVIDSNDGPLNGINLTNITNAIGECLGYDKLPTQNTTIIYSVSTCSFESCSMHNGITSLLVTVYQTVQPYGTKGLQDALLNKLEFLGEECKLGVEVIELWRFDGCREETEILHMEYNISITWPESNIAENIELNCPCGRLTETQYADSNATRQCRGSYTYGGIWGNSNVSCNYNGNNVNITLTLCHLTTVTDIHDLSSGLAEVSKDAESFEELDFTISALILEELALSEEIVDDKNLQNNYVESINNIVLTNKEVVMSSSRKHNSANKILRSIDMFQDRIVLTESRNTNNGREMVTSFHKERFATIVTEVDYKLFNNQTFVAEVTNSNISIISTDENPEELINELNKASISIPQSVVSKCPSTERVRIAYNVFTANVLFGSNENSSAANIIISATACSGTIIDGLVQDQVTIEMPKPEYLRNGTNTSESFCVFFNITENGWSQNGCTNTSGQDEDYVRCKCNHLTHFGYLFDVKPPADEPENVVLEVISYIGAIVSILCLVVTIVTFIGSSKLLKRTQGKTLINMCIALIGVYVTYLIAGHAKSIRSVNGGHIICAFFGALLYYFMLVYFMWTAIEAVDLYRKVVRVFSKGSKYFIICSIIIGWSVPLVIIAISVGFGHEYYTQYELFCRPTELPFYIGFLAPFGLVYIFNWIVFIRIIVSLIMSSKHKKQKDDYSSEIRKIFFIAIVLSVNFGLGWSFGLLGTAEFPRPVYLTFVYLFSIFVGMQGVLIFILHCARTRAAREIWTRWILVICMCKRPEEAKFITRQMATNTGGGTPAVSRKPAPMAKPSRALDKHAIPLYMQHYTRQTSKADMGGPKRNEMYKNPVHGLDDMETETRMAPSLVFDDIDIGKELSKIEEQFPRYDDNEQESSKKLSKKESKQQLRKQESKQLRKQESKQLWKQESKQLRKQESKQLRKQESKQLRKQESKQLWKQESKQLRKQESKSEANKIQTEEKTKRLVKTKTESGSNLKMLHEDDLAGSTYSLGEVSLTGSEALEIEFAPSLDASDDESTTWIDLEKQFADIGTLDNADIFEEFKTEDNFFY